MAGVPTIPRSDDAMGLFAGSRPLPAGAFRRQHAGGARPRRPWPAPSAVVAAFPAADPGGFAATCDLIASSFALLACWDEHTVSERDRYDRLPYAASVFSANPELKIDEPAVDGYVELLRAVLAPRLAALGLEPLPEPGWMWGDKGYAVALTHDLDNLWRWTRRGFAATGYRAARGVSRRDWGAARRELGDAGDWLVRHLPRRTDPYWTFPQMLGGEDARGVSSTFYVIARHTHRQDGTQPETYHRRLPRGARRCSPGTGARSACTATTPTASRWTRWPRTARSSRTRRAARCTASATTTCAACTTRHCRCWSRPASATTRASRSPSTRGSAAGAPSPSARTRWPRSAPST